MSEIKPVDTEPLDMEPTKTVTETPTLKRAYTMSDSKREQLARARARALELRNDLNKIKPPKEKTVKVQPPSQLKIKISEIQAVKPVEPVTVTQPEVPEPTEVPEVPKTKQKKPPPPIKQQPSLTFSFPPPTQPPVGFQRNYNGFYVL